MIQAETATEAPLNPRQPNTLHWREQMDEKVCFQRRPLEEVVMELFLAAQAVTCDERNGHKGQRPERGRL